MSVGVGMGSSRVGIALSRVLGSSIGISSDACLSHLVGGDTFVQTLVGGSVKDLITLSTVALGSTLYTVQESNVLSVPVAD